MPIELLRFKEHIGKLTTKAGDKDQISDGLIYFLIIVILLGLECIGIYFAKYATLQEDVVKSEEDQALFDRMDGFKPHEDIEEEDDDHDQTTIVRTRFKLWRHKDDEEDDTNQILGERCPICGKIPSECTCGLLKKKKEVMVYRS